MKLKLWQGIFILCILFNVCFSLVLVVLFNKFNDIKMITDISSWYGLNIVFVYFMLISYNPDEQ